MAQSGSPTTRLTVTVESHDTNESAAATESPFASAMTLPPVRPRRLSDSSRTPDNQNTQRLRVAGFQLESSLTETSGAHPLGSPLSLSNSFSPDHRGHHKGYPPRLDVEGSAFQHSLQPESQPKSGTSPPLSIPPPPPLHYRTGFAFPSPTTYDEGRFKPSRELTEVTYRRRGSLSSENTPTKGGARPMVSWSVPRTMQESSSSPFAIGGNLSNTNNGSCNDGSGFVQVDSECSSVSESRLLLENSGGCGSPLVLAESGGTPRCEITAAHTTSPVATALLPQNSDLNTIVAAQKGDSLKAKQCDSELAL